MTKGISHSILHKPEWNSAQEHGVGGNRITNKRSRKYTKRYINESSNLSLQNSGNQRKLHRPWTVSEVKKLIDAVAHFGDNWRNLLKACRALKGSSIENFPSRCKLRFFGVLKEPTQESKRRFLHSGFFPASVLISKTLNHITYREEQ